MARRSKKPEPAPGPKIRESFWPAIKGLLNSKTALAFWMPMTVVACAHPECRKELKVAGFVFKGTHHPQPAFMVRCGHMYCGPCVEKISPGRQCVRCKLDVSCRICRETEAAQIPSGWQSRCHVRAVPLSSTEMNEGPDICVQCVRLRDLILMDMRGQEVEENEALAEKGVRYLLQETRRQRTILLETEGVARKEVMDMVKCGELTANEDEESNEDGDEESSNKDEQPPPKKRVKFSSH